MIDQNLRLLTAQIVESFVSHNRLSLEDLELFVSSVYASLSGATEPPAADQVDTEQAKPTPGQIRKSITPNGITSFLDGKTYRSLRRHLAAHGHTPETYREAFGLPASYRMISETYSKTRSDMARAIGLGRGGPGAQPIPPAKAAPVAPELKLPPKKSMAAVKAPAAPTVAVEAAKPSYPLPPEVPAPVKGRPGRKPRANRAASEAELIAGSGTLALPDPDFE